MQKDIDNIQKILLEMPQKMIPIEDNSYEKYSNNIELLVSKSEEFLKNPNIEIRRAINESDDFVLFFIKNGALIAGYSYKPEQNYIKTKSSWSNPAYKNSFYNVFTNFIIPSFKVVESDDRLTDLGYKFWVKLVDNNSNFSFFVKKNTGVFQVHSSYELKDYYGDGVSYQDFKFVVSTK